MKQEVICAGALTEETLSEAVSLFLREIRPGRQRLMDYYHGCQPVPKGEAVRGRPNNHLHIPFPRYISEVHTGYFLGIPPTLSFSSPQAGTVWTSLCAQTQMEHLIFDVGRDLSVCGAGFLLVWLEQAGLRATRCDPRDCFTIRSGGAGSPLLATVRLYQDPAGNTRGVLYQTEALTPFSWEGGQADLSAPEPNLLRALPLVPFLNNTMGDGDFEMVTGLVDAYNLLLSGALDDMQSVANAFLALYGMQGTTQADIDQANRSRVLCLSEGGRAEFVVKELNHEALGQLETNLRRSILQLSMTPDLSDESFAADSSGVALQYKLWGVEQVRAAKERCFRAGLRGLLEALTGGIRVLGMGEDLTTGVPAFHKNLPQDMAAQAQTLLSLSPLLSRRTILEQLPWVEDVEKELQRKAQETHSGL